MLFEHITAEHLMLKLATTSAEIEAAQRLRYIIFYEEMGAKPIGEMAVLRRDYDAYDTISDHLIVVDERLPLENQVIGTYRMLTDAKAKEQNSVLYAETEFDIDKLRATGKKIMEISRSCILPDYRNKTAINLLWKGIAACVFKNDIGYLIGTPSFSGTDPNDFIQELSYLFHYHMADEAVRPESRSDRLNSITLLPKDSIDVKKVFAGLPPLLKGYLRIGTKLGQGIYIDEQFNMVDVSIMLDIDNVTDRYFNHYKRYDK
jgi:putative hemolysin